jgi:hypothetical protein
MTPKFAISDIRRKKKVDFFGGGRGGIRNLGRLRSLGCLRNLRSLRDLES